MDPAWPMSIDVKCILNSLQKDWDGVFNFTEKVNFLGAVKI